MALLLQGRCAGAVTATQRLVRARTRTAIFVVGGGIPSRWCGPSWTGVGSLPASRIFSSSSSSSSSRIVSNLDGVAEQQQSQALLHTNISSLGTTGTFSSYARNAAALALTALIGFGMGRWSGAATTNPPLLEHEHQHAILPNGLPRTCCEESDDPENDNHNNHTTSTSLSLTEAQQDLLRRYRRLVGDEHVLDCTAPQEELSASTTAPYLVGARIGGQDTDEAPPPTLCVVSPTQLHQVADIVEWAIHADCVVLAQGQNTGLTGGSVPHTKSNHDAKSNANRPIVVLSMKQLTGIVPLDDGQRVVCMAGVGLASLQEFLNENFPDRESHSVLGSTFLNPTTAAGVAFGSGGTQCRKGPAYTERALYLKITTNKWHEKIVETVNTLDIPGLPSSSVDDDAKFAPGRARKHMDSAAYRIDSWSRWIRDDYDRSMKYTAPNCTRKASNSDEYATKLCRHDNDNNTVNRCNADTSGPDPCRCEGKVIILATVHDTFPKPKSTQTFWLSFDTLETALAFRQQVCLQNPKDLPISVEYMDRDAFDVVDQSGRVLGNIIQWIPGGATSPLIRQFWNLKLWFEALPGMQHSIDKLLHQFNHFTPALLPQPVMELGRSMNHHVMMTIGDFGDGNLERCLDRLNQFVAQQPRQSPPKIVVFECKTPSQVRALTAFRFVAAPAFRTYCIGNGLHGISVDYALPNHSGAAPPLHNNSSNTEIPTPRKRMRYSHFACNVVHEDLAYDNDATTTAERVHDAKMALKQAVEEVCQGKLPAEHGHGTEYTAPPATQERWKRMDPLNVLNPGIGGLSEQFRYQEEQQ